MTTNTELIYLMDPHCGWCFGFSTVISKLVAHYDDDERLKLSLVTGGLFHPALKTNTAFADEKRPIAKRVSKHFKVRFSEAYFTNVLGSGHLDSLVPCQAINTVQLLSPEKTFFFAHDLVNAAFIDGLNISSLDVCIYLAEQFGLEKTQFSSIYESTEAKEMTAQSFAFAQQVRTGFPSLFLKTNDDLVRLGGAELTLEKSIRAIESHLE